MASPAWRGPLAVRFGVLAAAAIVSAVGAWLGAWWLPFPLGVAVGLLKPVRPSLLRGSGLAAVAGAVVGWLIPIWVLALRGEPVGATARVIAALAGLPPQAAVTVAVAALLAALQVLVGAWLGGAVANLRPPAPATRAPAAEPGQRQVTEDPGT